MMKGNNRNDYGSASEWLSELRQDELWLSQLQQLQDAAGGDLSSHREDAIRRIDKGFVFEYWKIYQHQVEKVVGEVWRDGELSLAKLRMQTIGMLSMEWLEQHAPTEPDEQQQEVVEKLRPIFFGDVEDAKAFLVSIQGMKPTQITEKVNQLVRERKISDMSKRRNLWKVLHDCGIYNKSESNWNMQVK